MVGRIDGWLTTPFLPSVAGRSLVDRASPARWLRDTRLSLTTPEGPYIEFFGGDRLPGRLVTCQGSGDRSLAAGPPAAVVEVAVGIDPPGLVPRQSVRVLIEPIQRVVWEASDKRRLEPGNLFRRDGGRIAFRAITWSGDSVRLLTDDGVKSMATGDLAEVHLPAVDGWTAYCRQLATLTPAAQSPLVTFEANAGLRVTTSWERLRGWSSKSQPTEADGHLVVQPAWSLEPIWIKLPDVRRALFFSPDEMALAWQEPARSVHRSALSSAWTQWERDANIDGNPLRSGGQVFAWGFGVHAHHELEFAVPPAARGFATRFGLDAAAGSGGSVRGRPELVSGKPNDEPPLAHVTTPLLIGSSRPTERLEMAIPESARAPARLRLVADAALDATEAGADPLDVRDVCDWLEPCWLLDGPRLQRETVRLAPSVSPALHGWTLEGEPGRDYRLENVWQAATRPLPEFRTRLVPVGVLRLSRTIHVTRERTELRLPWSRPDGSSSPCEIEVNVEGNRLGRFATPVYDEARPAQPITIQLAELVGRDARIEITLRPHDRTSFVELGNSE
jgi:hypothetical protein